MKTAVQLYSIRLLCENDLKLGLKNASEQGYQGVEFAGFFNHTAKEVKSWLNEYHLEAMGAHVAPELIFDNTDEVISYHKEIGNNRIICPWYDLKTRADVEEFVAKAKIASKKLKENGMQLYYHNHAHEFTMDNGEYLLNIMADLTTKDELMFELDVYWVFMGNENPCEYIKKYADRLDIFHAKDGDKDKGTAAGKGDVPLKAIFNLANELGVEWAVVESEAEGSADEQLDDIKTSIEYIKTII